MFNNNLFISKFFDTSDDYMVSFKWKDLEWNFKEKKWWSRMYEYCWVKNVCNDYFKNKSNKSILDVGTGNKHPNLFLMKSINFGFCKGIDIFDEKKYQYKKYLNKTLLYCKHDIIKKNIEKYNCITCISVMEHMDIKLQKKMLINMLKSLKKEGIILLTFDYPGFDYYTDLVTYKKIFYQNNIFFKEKRNEGIKINSYQNKNANKIDRKKKIFCYRLLGIKK